MIFKVTKQRFRQEKSGFFCIHEIVTNLLHFHNESKSYAAPWCKQGAVRQQLRKLDRTIMNTPVPLLLTAMIIVGRMKQRKSRYSNPL